MTRHVVFTLAFAGAAAGWSAAQEKTADPRTAAFGDLLNQKEYKASLDIEVKVLGWRVRTVIDDILARAEDADGFRKAWRANYRTKQGVFPDKPGPDAGTITSFKAEQRTLFAALAKEVRHGSDACTELSTTGEERWEAWLVVTRSLLWLAERVPDYPGLAGIEQVEAEALQSLRKSVHESLAKRREEWYRYLEQAERAAPKKTIEPTFVVRNALDKQLAELLTREKQLSIGWGEYLNRGEFPAAWREYFAEAEAGKSRNLKLEATTTRQWAERKGGVQRADERAKVIDPPTFSFSGEGYISWPFTLAEHLKLGRLRVGYDAVGFDAPGEWSQSNPVVVPRIHLRGAFVPLSVTNQKEVLTAVDLRMSGKPTPVASFGLVPLQARSLTSADKLSDRVSQLADARLKGVAITLQPPLTPDEETQVKAAMEKAKSDWRTELTGSLQENAAVYSGIGGYWSGLARPSLPGAFPDPFAEFVSLVGVSALARPSWPLAFPDWTIRLAEEWRRTALLSEGELLPIVASAAVTRPDDLGPLVGDHPAVRDLILRAGQADAKATLERLLGEATGKGFDEVRQPYEDARSLIREQGGDLTAAVSAEGLLHATAQSQMGEWTRYLAGMLPAPQRPIHRHPWPGLFSPAESVAPDPSPLYRGTRRTQRELDRLLFARLAPAEGGGQSPLHKTLVTVGDSFSVADIPYLQPNFVNADGFRRRYAEVDRLVLLGKTVGVTEWTAVLVSEKRNELHAAEMLARSLALPQHRHDRVRVWMMARSGLPHAQFVLGELYESGQGMPSDPYAAAVQYVAAARQGHPTAARAVSRLAAAFAAGQGVPKDADQARRLKAIEEEIGSPR